MKHLSALLLVAALLGATAACSPPRHDLPTFTVEKRPFEHRVTADGHLEAAKVTRLTVPSEVQWQVRLAWLAPEGRIEEGELVARFDPDDMRVRLREGELDLESAELEVKKTTRESESKITSHEIDLRLADLELDHAQQFKRTDTTVFSKNEIIESQIDETLAGERKEHANASRKTEASLGQTELDLLAIEKRRAQLKIDQAKEGLEALEVRAPHAGIFAWSRNWRGEPSTVGQELFRGQAVGEIPNLDVMEAEVFVLEADAGGLEVGKNAEVVLEAHPKRAWPARIARIDAVAKPRFRGSPVQYFGVTLELLDTDDLPARPGQRIRATLFLEERDAALVVPRQAIFGDSSAPRVYVVEGDGFTAREVEIASQSMGLVVLDEGIEEGDVVALEEPDLAKDGDGDGDGDGDPA